MEAAIKHLEEEKQKKRKLNNSSSSARASQQVASTSNLAGSLSASQRRNMNSSQGSFKQASNEVRAGAKEDLDKISMGSAKLAKKKMPVPSRPLRPIASTGQVPTAKSGSKAHASDIIISDSLQHKPRIGVSDQGALIDMGLGPGKSLNQQKRQRKDMLKDIEKDVKQFMEDFSESKEAAIAFDDCASSVSGVSALSKDSKILSQINSAFSSTSHKTKAELLLWQRQQNRKQPKTTQPTRTTEEEPQNKIASLTAKNLMQLGSRGPKKGDDLQPINEEGADGKLNTDQIYVDPEDPKKKKYDELKRKALLLAQRKEKRRMQQQNISDSESIKSDGTSKNSVSQISLGQSVGTTSSVAGPFMTHARMAKSLAQPSVRQSTPPRLQSEGLATFKKEFASLTGKAAQRERSYSPVYRAKGLNDEDPNDLYMDRMAEMALEMDQAFDYLKEIGTFLETKEDVGVLEECEKEAEKAIDQHIDLLEDLSSMMLQENDEADKYLREMMELHRSLGMEVEEPVLSIEGQKILEKERKKRKKIASFYDIAEDEKEDAENSDIEAEEEKMSEQTDSQALALLQPSILTRVMESMNHNEAQKETADALMSMMDSIRDQSDHLADLLGIEDSKVSGLIKGSTRDDTMSQFSASKSFMTSSVMSSSAVPLVAKTTAARNFEKKMDKQEDRKLDRIAAEAQAFLLNNQKREMVESDLGSVTSIGKGTIKDSVSTATKKCPRVVRSGRQQVPSVGLGLGSFSKTGKSLANKF